MYKKIFNLKNVFFNSNKLQDVAKREPNPEISERYTISYESGLSYFPC